MHFALFFLFLLRSSDRVSDQQFFSRTLSNCLEVPTLPLFNSPSIILIKVMTSPRFSRIEVSHSQPNVLFKATVYGKPAALQCPRIKFPLFFATILVAQRLWNPSSDDQQQIRMLIKNYLEASDGIEYNENAPFFHEGTAIKVKLTFFMNHPSSHFLYQANVGAAVWAYNFVTISLPNLDSTE